MDFLLSSWTSLLPGAAVTITVTLLTIPLLITLGLALALARMSNRRLLRVVATGIVEVVRGTPLLVQLFWIFYALPFAGVVLPPLGAGVIALSLNHGAYASEIFRAGIQAVPKGQLEAAAVLGMSRRTTLRRVVLPQALVLILPPLGNNVIELFKATSLLSIVAAGEIVLYARRLLVQTSNPTGVWVLVAIFYFVLCISASVALSWIERRAQRGARAAERLRYSEVHGGA